MQQFAMNLYDEYFLCVVYLYRNDGSDFSGSIYQKVNDSLETAINVGWASTTNTTRFALGAKYALDSDATLNAKVSNTSQFGIGYTQSLRPGESSVSTSCL